MGPGLAPAQDRQGTCQRDQGGLGEEWGSMVYFGGRRKSGVRECVAMGSRDQRPSWHLCLMKHKSFTLRKQMISKNQSQSQRGLGWASKCLVQHFSLTLGFSPPSSGLKKSQGVLYLRLHSCKRASQGQDEEEWERHNGADTAGGSEGCREGSQQDNAQMSPFLQPGVQTNRKTFNSSNWESSIFAWWAEALSTWLEHRHRRLWLRLQELLHTKLASRLLCRNPWAWLPRPWALLLIMFLSLKASSRLFTGGWGGTHGLRGCKSNIHSWDPNKARQQIS